MAECDRCVYHFLSSAVSRNALNSPFSLPVGRNAACKVTFIGGDPLRPEPGLFPMPVIQDPVSSQEAAAAASSLLWTAIVNIFAWSIPSAPPKVRSVLPINDHQRTWEAHDSCDFLGACSAGSLIPPFPPTHSPITSEQNRQLPAYTEIMMHIKYVRPPSRSGRCFTFFYHALQQLWTLCVVARAPRVENAKREEGRGDREGLR